MDQCFMNLQLTYQTSASHSLLVTETNTGHDKRTAPISCSSPHDSSHYDHAGGFIPPDGGSLEDGDKKSITQQNGNPLLLVSELTRGSLFFTSRTIFTDSSSSSSSKSSGSGGSTGSKLFWATVSCTESTA